MDSEGKRILTIICELVKNSLQAESSNININIKLDDDKFEIIIIDNGKGMDKSTLKKAKRILNQPHRQSYDEYYSGLGGTFHGDSGLNLIGFQIDKAEIESSDDGTIIRIIRNTNKSS